MPSPAGQVVVTADDAPEACPAGHGVVVIRINRRCTHLAATADARAALDAKIWCDAPIGDEALVWPAGSSFEADLLALDLSQDHAPEQHAQAIGRLCVWWLAADLDAPGAGWRVTDLLEVIPKGTVLGPFVDRASAGRWSAMLDDRFELCRYPAELKKAPRGTPCSYRDMGLCPAACDGSEPMSAYLHRFRRAIGLRSGGLVELRGGLRSAMESAANQGRFEAAGVLRDAAEALPAETDPAAMAVDELGSFEFVAVAPGRGRARVVLLSIGAGGWRRLGAVDAREASADGLLAMADQSGNLDGFDAGVIGLTARELIRPRRGGPELIRRSGLDPESLWSAVRRVGKIADA